MTPKQIFSKVRMDPAINDNAAVVYSDYQMLAALNTVLSVVYSTIAASSNTILNEIETIDIKNGSAELPDDFLQAVFVQGSHGYALTPQTKSKPVDAYTYKIRGNRIYTKSERVELEYKPYFEQIGYDEIEDDLALPNMFLELLKKYVALSLAGSITDADMVAQLAREVYSLTANRGLTALIDDIDPVWKV